MTEEDKPLPRAAPLDINPIPSSSPGLHALSDIREEETAEGLRTRSQTNAVGPLPHPNVVAGWAKLLPDAPARIFSTFERESSHRHHMESDRAVLEHKRLEYEAAETKGYLHLKKIELELAAQAQKDNASMERWGLIIGTLVILIFLIAGIWLVLRFEDKWSFLVAFGGMGILAIMSGVAKMVDSVKRKRSTNPLADTISTSLPTDKK